MSLYSLGTTETAVSWGRDGGPCSESETDVADDGRSGWFLRFDKKMPEKMHQTLMLLVRVIFHDRRLRYN